MPTLILLDVSLSMARGWRDSSADTSPQSRSNLLNLATIGINTLLDFFTQNCKLEYVSMLQYSSLWEALVPFTRDYQVSDCRYKMDHLAIIAIIFPFIACFFSPMQLVKEKMKTCAIADKTCLEAGLVGAATSVTDDWDSGTPVQVTHAGKLIWSAFFVVCHHLSRYLFHRSSSSRTEAPASVPPPYLVLSVDGDSKKPTNARLPRHFLAKRVVERRGDCEMGAAKAVCGRFQFISDITASYFFPGSRFRSHSPPSSISSCCLPTKNRTWKSPFLCMRN